MPVLRNLLRCRFRAVSLVCQLKVCQLPVLVRGRRSAILGSRLSNRQVRDGQHVESAPQKARGEAVTHAVRREALNPRALDCIFPRVLKVAIGPIKENAVRSPREVSQHDDKCIRQ